MKLTRLAFTCLSATAGLAATAGLWAAGLTATAAPGRQDTPALRVAVYDCTSQPQVRPAAFDIFCDGSRSLIKLSWSSWNLSEAVGTGVDYTDLCPSCVQGKWQHQDVVDSDSGHVVSSARAQVRSLNSSFAAYNSC